MSKPDPNTVPLEKTISKAKLKVNFKNVTREDKAEEKCYNNSNFGVWMAITYEFEHIELVRQNSVGLVTAGYVIVLFSKKAKSHMLYIVTEY